MAWFIALNEIRRMLTGAPRMGQVAHKASQPPRTLKTKSATPFSRPVTRWGDMWLEEKSGNVVNLAVVTGSRFPVRKHRTVTVTDFTYLTREALSLGPPLPASPASLSFTLIMSCVVTSPMGESPPSELWAGKSRNAKAQARHRAKRKAYIEQLEQTVSKLQTALALSPEEVSNLPSTQAKLRELKEENDSLRAELRKFQNQPPASGYLVPVQVHSPPLSDEFPRRSKRRKMSPARAADLELRNAYLAIHSSLLQASADPSVDAMSTSHGNYASSRSLVSASVSLDRTMYPLQHTNSMAPKHSSIEPPVLREAAPFSWTPFTHQPNPTHQVAPAPCSSSDSGPPYMASTQSHNPVQMALTPISSSYKSPLANNHITRPEPTSKAYYNHSSEESTAVYGIPSEIPMNACSSQDPGSTWPDAPSWSYSFVRMQ
ncbi:hypothetical protein JB92DRAFT_2830458 [Gautieria morchelliformis]|nr:hypothetical protein JB92DRAFT_2830458 [Gautieria morchelliformis]